MFPKKKKVRLGIVFLCIIFPLATGVAFAQVSSMKKTVELGKKYAGITLTLPWEAGFQSQAVYAVAPTWEKLTGMKIRVDELDYQQLHDKQVTEYLAGTGFYDVVTYQTALMGDFVEGGLSVSLEPFIEKYMDKADLDDYLPICLKAFSMYKNECRKYSNKANFRMS